MIHGGSIAIPLCWIFKRSMQYLGKKHMKLWICLSASNLVHGFDMLLHNTLQQKSSKQNKQLPFSQLN